MLFACGNGNASNSSSASRLCAPGPLDIIRYHRITANDIVQPLLIPLGSDAHAQGEEIARGGIR